MHYIPPGTPTQPAPAAQPNSYIVPNGPLPQLPPSPQPPPPTPQACDQEPHRVLFASWRAHHGSDWVRADKLSPTVRRMIDERERLPAVRQKLRQFVDICRDGFKLEAKTVGNAARPVAFYCVVESESAGLEG